MVTLAQTRSERFRPIRNWLESDTTTITAVPNETFREAQRQVAFLLSHIEVGEDTPLEIRKARNKVQRWLLHPIPLVSAVSMDTWKEAENILQLLLDMVDPPESTKASNEEMDFKEAVKLLTVGSTPEEIEKAKHETADMSRSAVREALESGDVRFVCRACGHRWKNGEDAGLCPHPARRGRHEVYSDKTHVQWVPNAPNTSTEPEQWLCDLAQQNEILAAHLDHAKAKGLTFEAMVKGMLTDLDAERKRLLRDLVEARSAQPCLVRVELEGK